MWEETKISFLDYKKEIKMKKGTLKKSIALCCSITMLATSMPFTAINIKAATGDFIVFADHDDELTPNALFECVKALNKNRDVKVLYSDEDKMSMDGHKFFQPHFKPDYNPDLLCTVNYICHLFVVDRKVIEQVGTLRKEFDGAQDHDFIFRCTERAESVLHIPKVLYSWRSHEASTATNPESKLYAYEAGKRAVSAHLARTGRMGTPQNTDNYGFYRVCYPGAPSILKNSFEKFDGQTGVNVVYYGKVCNISVTINSEDRYVLFMHVRNQRQKHTRVNAQFYEALKACCDRPDTGLACARVYDARKRLAGDIRMRGVKDPFSDGMKGLKYGYTGYNHRAVLQQELEQPTDCFMVRADILKTCVPEGGEVSVETLAAKLTESGYHIYYEPWAVLYEG